MWPELECRVPLEAGRAKRAEGRKMESAAAHLRLLELLIAEK